MTATPAKPLTPRQRELLDFIIAYFGQFGCSPTTREIGTGMGVSHISAYEMTGLLERKGWITRDKHRARSIRARGGGLPEMWGSDRGGRET